VRLLQTLLATYIEESELRQSASLRQSVQLLERAMATDLRLLQDKQQQLAYMQTRAGLASPKADAVKPLLQPLLSEQTTVQQQMEALRMKLDEAEQRAPTSSQTAYWQVELQQLSERLDKINARMDALFDQQRALQVLEEDILTIRDRYAQNKRAVNDHHIIASEFIGYASLVENPSALPDRINTSPYLSALIGALMGAACCSLWLASRRSATQKALEMARRAVRAEAKAIMQSRHAPVSAARNGKSAAAAGATRRSPMPASPVSPSKRAYV